MHFERSELQQLTSEYVENLPTEQKSNLIEHLRKDLMQAQDRLNLSPSNSSKPPSSRAPWDRSTGKDNQTPEDKLSDCGDEEELPNGGETGSSKSGESNPKGDKGNKKRNPGIWYQHHADMFLSPSVKKHVFWDHCLISIFSSVSLTMSVDLSYGTC